MMNGHDADSSRRAFLAQVGAGSAALLGTPALLAAAASVAQAQGMSDRWLNGITGKHRQYFDATSVDNGFSLAYAMNWMDTMKATYKVTDKDLSAVIGLRHFSIPLAYTDEIWAKYKLGEFAKVNDPKTNAPSTRNFYYKPQEGDLAWPSMAINQLQPRGVTFVVCNIAHTVISGMVAKNAGVTPEQAKAEFEKGLIPGFTLVPSGVLAVNQAQEKGKCTYCYAG